MIFYGAGGHAKVVIEAYRASGGTVDAIIDDNPTVQELMGMRVLRYTPTLSPNIELLISVGNNRGRQRLAESVAHKFGQIRHPASVLSPSANVKMGSVIMAGAVVQACVRIGRHVIINTGALLDHESIVGDFVHVAPGAVICGSVEIGDGAMIGAGATIIPGIKIGQWATVAAGAVVTKDVPDGHLVMGIPARRVNRVEFN